VTAVPVTVTVPGLRIRSVANLREHWSVRRKRVNDEKLALMAELLRVPQAVAESVRCTGGPLRVRFVRLGGKPLDSDNLASGFKACRDQLAKWLGRDDGTRAGIEWHYAQELAKGYGVRVTVEAMPT